MKITPRDAINLLKLNLTDEEMNREIDIEDLMAAIKFEKYKDLDNPIVVEILKRTGYSKEEFYNKFFVLPSGLRKYIEDNAKNHGGYVQKNFMLRNNLTYFHIIASFNGEYRVEGD